LDVKDILLGLGIMYGAVKSSQLSNEVEKLKSRVDKLSTEKIRIRRYVLQIQGLQQNQEVILGEWEGGIIVFNFYEVADDYIELKFETPYETSIIRTLVYEEITGYSLVKIALNYVKLTAKNTDTSGSIRYTPKGEVFVIDIPNLEVIV